jgi:hypothetical protein
MLFLLFSNNLPLRQQSNIMVLTWTEPRHIPHTWCTLAHRDIHLHIEYAPQGVEVCAGLRQVWVREVTVRSSARDAYKRVNPQGCGYWTINLYFKRSRTNILINMTLSQYTLHRNVPNIPCLYSQLRIRFVNINGVGISFIISCETPIRPKIALPSTSSSPYSVTYDLWIK